VRHGHARRILAFRRQRAPRVAQPEVPGRRGRGRREAGCEVTLLDLNELALPLYHGDLEDRGDCRPNAVRLPGSCLAPGLLVASPEYNSMITPLLKNTLDWCSRADDNPFEGKVAAVMSASPGPFGGVGSLQLAQQLLLKLGCHVVPGQCVLPHADKAFDPEGRLATRAPGSP
jgi:chromate reductase, NAD(P)H dehydrogenase (quinone)